jgi:RNA polymerase sigma factor (sigma-70 family)
MGNAQMDLVLRHLHTLVAKEKGRQLPDRQLLERFLAERDEAAFAELVKRHGPMVLNVCQSVLRHREDAEDAFQATFLVLAQKAETIKRRDALSSWLYGVAHHLALRAQTRAARRRSHEERAEPMAAADPLLDMTVRELRGVLYEELQRLPEKYRAPLVLCYVEGKTNEEAARQLGCGKGVLRGRLNRGREQLRVRLKRRGLTLGAGLLTTALAVNPGSAAVPASLIQATAKAALAANITMVSPQVTALLEGATKAMFTTKTKFAIVLLVAAGVVAAGVGVLNFQRAAAQPTPTRAKDVSAPSAKAEDQPKPEPALKEAGAALTLSGRVLDPDGKPLAGAEITLWSHFGYEGYYRDWHPTTTKPLEPKFGATSGEDGRFRVRFAKSEIDENPMGIWEQPWKLIQVVAAVKGYGPAWASLVQLDKRELTLKLAKDDVPVKGRVLDLEGRPVAGAAVRVVRVTVGKDGFGSLWQPSWAGLSADVTTDRDGRFALSGVGRGRNVLLSIEGSRIEHKLVAVTTPAADAAPASGIGIEVVAKPTKPVEGTVRVKGTGKPLAGVIVYGEEGAHHRRVRAITDDRGQYRLVGLPKAPAYRLTVYPSLDSGCLSTFTTVADGEGLRPITVDFEVRRGIQVRCRFIDKETKEPVRGELRYTPLEVNPLHVEADGGSGRIPNHESSRVHVPGPDGVFRLLAYSGPGLLYGNLQGNALRYLHAKIDPADFAKARGDGHLEMAKLGGGAYRLIDPKEGDKPLVVDVELDPGRKASGSLIGPDGKPVTGAMAYGLNHHPQRWTENTGQHLTADAFTVTLLAPGQSRTISFVHKQRKLIGHLMLKEDEKGPIAVRMEAWGVLTGRLVDGDGKPVAGVRLGWRYPSFPAPGMAPPAEPFTTDAEGRFRVEGLAPGMKFDVTFPSDAKKATTFSAGEALKGQSLEPGQTKDLGDVRVTATPAPKKTGNRSADLGK